jgi:hypothetical protein
MTRFGEHTKRKAYTKSVEHTKNVEYITKEETATINSLTDKRLLWINTWEDGFYDAVTNCKSKNQKINEFIEYICKVKDNNVAPFYKPIYDPSEYGDIITYQRGKNPAVGHSYNWWVKTASKMPAVEGRHWYLATEYQYYAFLVWLINQLVKCSKSVEEALNMVVLNSKELGHYCDSQDSTRGGVYERTGSRCVCGVYDLANTCKILECSTEIEVAFLIVGGNCTFEGRICPLASFARGLCRFVDDKINTGVGFLVL